MTEVMTIQSKGKTLLKESTPSENHYVRIRNGLYKSDLAQVRRVSRGPPLDPLWTPSKTWVYIVNGEACEHKALTPETRALTVIGPEE
eukprot:2464581-Pyramimonas_sp.AAC.1